MDGTKKPVRKRLADVIVEAGILSADELPRGLEYAQKATDADVEMVGGLKVLIEQQGLSVPTALRALILAKQKHCDLSEALIAIGWRPRRPESVESQAGERRSMFSAEELDAIGSKRATAQNSVPGLAAGLKASGISSQLTSTGSRIAAWKPEGSDVPPARPAQPPPLPVQQPRTTQPPPLPSAGVQSERTVAEASPQSVSPPPLPAHPRTSDALSVSAHPTEAHPAEEVAPPDMVLVQTSELIYNGDRLYGEHQYEQAEGYYSRALDILERQAEGRELHVAELLVKLGRACMQQSFFGRSEAHFTRALKIREERLGQEDILTAECLDFLAELYDVQSQYLEAEHFYLTALGVKERVLRPGDSEIVRSLKKLVAVSKHRAIRPDEKLSGQLLTEAGIIDARKLEEGLNIAHERALPIGRALISLNYLSEEDLQSVLQAQLLLREGCIPGYLAVRALRIASEQRVDLYTALHEIGLEPEKADNKVAFDLLEAANELVAVEGKLDAQHPDVALLCMKVGELYEEHQRNQHAERLYRRALSIFEATEPQSEHVFDLLMRLGHLHFRCAQPDDSEKALTTLIDLMETAGKDTEVQFFNVLESLAAVHYVRGDYAEAGRLYQVCLNNKEKLLSADHPALSTSLQGRANCYYAAERYPDAERLYRRVLTINDKVFGANNERNAPIHNALGDLNCALKQYAQAQAEYSAGLDCLAHGANPDVWLFSVLLQKAATCYVQLQDFQRADLYFKQFLQAREKAGTHTTPDIAAVLESYAFVAECLGRSGEAASLLARAKSLGQ